MSQDTIIIVGLLGRVILL